MYKKMGIYGNPLFSLVRLGFAFTNKDPGAVHIFNGSVHTSNTELIGALRNLKIA